MGGGEFAGELAAALRRRNRHLNEFGRLRLRLAADHGDVVLRPPNFGGAAVALAVWLCESEELKAASAAAPELDQVLIVSDRFHEAARGRPGVPAGLRPGRRRARNRVAADRSGYWDAEYRHRRWVGTDVATEKGPAMSTFTSEWQDWKTRREEDLAAPHGWLALVSLDWLTDTPREYPGIPGRWWQDADAAYVDPAGASLTHEGSPIAETRRFELVNSGAGTRVLAGDVEIEVARRSGYLIRVHDPKAEVLRAFHGVPATSRLRPGCLRAASSRSSRRARPRWVRWSRA